MQNALCTSAAVSDQTHTLKKKEKKKKKGKMAVILQKFILEKSTRDSQYLQVERSGYKWKLRVIQGLTKGLEHLQ